MTSKENHRSGYRGFSPALTSICLTGDQFNCMANPKTTNSRQLDRKTNAKFVATGLVRELYH